MKRQAERAEPRSEHAIQEAIREALGLEDGLCLWRNNVGVAQHWDPRSGKTLTVRYGLCTGSADLIGLLGGRFVALEVKRPGRAPTPEQAQFLALVRKLGGFAASVSSVLEARDAIARARAGASA